MLLALFNPYIGPYQVLPFRGRVDLGEIAMKGYSAFPQSSSITGTSPSDCLGSYPGYSLWGGLTPLQRCSWCILQLQPSGQDNEGVLWISQSSGITGTSPSDCLGSYPGHSLWGGLTPLQRCSWCILQLQPSGQGNEGVLWISQSSVITGTSPSDCFVSYPGHSLGRGLTPLQRCSWCILQPPS